MNTKVGPYNTYVVVTSSGTELIKAPTIPMSINTWKETHSKPVRVLEGLLNNEPLDIH